MRRSLWGHKVLRPGLLAVALIIGTGACSGGDSAGLASVAEDRTAEEASMQTASTDVSNTERADAESQPTSQSTDVETTTTTAATETSDGAVNLRPVVNPLWNPYDPDNFGEEFPSIVALGEVAQPNSSQSKLGDEVIEATQGRRDLPLGAGCSPGDAPLGDGIWAAGITAAGPSSITIDLVCLFRQQDDMFVAPNGLPCSGPFESADPCMTNSSGARRELTLAPTVEIVVARLLEQSTELTPPADLAPTTRADFLTYLELGTYTPFLIEVSKGEVTRIEQYRSLWLPGL